MRMMSAVVLTSLTLAAGGAVVADEAKKGAPPPPKPAPEMTALAKWLSGTWKCTGTNFAFAGMPETKYTSTFKVKSVLKGFALEAEYAEKNSVMQFEAVATIGWNQVDKRFEFHGPDSAGGEMDVTAPAGDNLAWEGTTIGPGPEGVMKGNVRFPWIKKGEKEMTMTFEMPGPDGKWNKMGEGVCKK